MSEVRARETERIWHEFHDRLYGFLVSRVRDEHAAADILQDVFLKVHKSLDALRDESKLAPWLYQIARNAIADHFRSRSSEPLDETLSSEAPADSEPAEQRLAESLGRMIESLPRRYRQAVMLTEIEGLTQAEMAEQLGLSLSGGKSRVQRGRERLKELLLECCEIELDRCGGVMSYAQRPTCCSH